MPHPVPTRAAAPPSRVPTTTMPHHLRQGSPCALPPAAARSTEPHPESARLRRLARSVPVPRLTWPCRRSQTFSSGHQLPFCYKNLGSAKEKAGRTAEAKVLYAQALDLDPHLPEAHYALALWHIRDGSNLASALDHLDSIVWPADSPDKSPAILGWRAETLFRLGRVAEAFRDINTLLSIGNDLDWLWPWCTKLVATYGRITLSSARLSVQFWDLYANEFPDDLQAKRERLLCRCHIHDEGGDAKYDYEDVKHAIADLVGSGVANPAFLWDRAGHWAQKDEDWYEAEKCHRRAYRLSPAEYGYC